MGHTRHLHTANNNNVPFTYFPKSADPDDVTVPKCYIDDPDCFDQYNFRMIPGFSDDPPSFEICGDIGSHSSPAPPCEDCDWSEGFVGGGDDEVSLATAIQSTLTPGTIGYTLNDPALQKEFRALLQSYGFANDYSGLKTYLDQFGDYFLPLQHSIAMQQKDYVLAANLLDQMEAYAGYEAFVLPQRVYLSWEQDNSYLPTEQEHQALQTYAHQDQPMAAFSRSVLNILYGENFVPTLPELEGAERSKAIEEVVSPAWLHPNPVDERLIVNPGERGVLRVFNALGQILLEKEVLNEEEIVWNTSEWSNGLYYIEFRGVETPIRIEKVIKQ